MANYQTIILLNLSKWENPNKPGTGLSLDVVQSAVDGKDPCKPPKDSKYKMVHTCVGVEKVSFRDGGAKRTGKFLNRFDFKTLKERWDEVILLMDNPPAVPESPSAEPLSGGSLGGGTMAREEF